MKLFQSFGSILILCLFNSTVCSDGFNPSPKNQSGLFLGIGGAYNFSTVHSTLSGTLSASTGNPPIGTFSGSTIYQSTHQTLAPEVQIGYFLPFTNPNWLWGFKLNYEYAPINAKDSVSTLNLLAPAINTIDNININPIRTKMIHELLLPAFIGHAISNGFIYLGAGPVLSKIQNQISGSDALSGFYIGNLNRWSQSKWVWGGAVQAGLAFYLNPTWLFNINYTYAHSKDTLNQSSTFTTNINGGLNSGTLSLSNSQSLTTQEIGVSINKLF